MKYSVLYQRDHFRRPVKREDMYLDELQETIPAGWCIRCGGEVYRPGTPLCLRCSRKAGC